MRTTESQMSLQHTINKFFKLVDKPLYPKYPLKLKEKKNLLTFLSKYSNHKIKDVEIFFYGSKNRFGNQIIMNSKIIFFCELLGCKRIILDKNINWFIKNKIYYSQYNMTIEPGNRFNFENRHTLIDLSINWLYYCSYIKSEIRSEVIKQEILKIFQILSLILKIFISISEVEIYLKRKYIMMMLFIHNHLYAFIKK